MSERPDTRNYPEHPDEAYIVPEPRSWDEVLIIDNDSDMTLTQMQTFVGGDIELHGLPDGRHAWVNNDGAYDMPVNRTLSNLARTPIMGPAIIVNGELEDAE